MRSFGSRFLLMTMLEVSLILFIVKLVDSRAGSYLPSEAIAATLIVGMLAIAILCLTEKHRHWFNVYAIVGGLFLASIGIYSLLSHISADAADTAVVCFGILLSLSGASRAWSAESIENNRISADGI